MAKPIKQKTKKWLPKPVPLEKLVHQSRETLDRIHKRLTRAVLPISSLSPNQYHLQIAHATTALELALYILRDAKLYKFDERDDKSIDNDTLLM